MAKRPKPRDNSKLTLDWHPLPKQLQFLQSTAQQILYSGGYGSGKSRSLAMWIVLRASRPGAMEGLFRKNLVTLKATTLRTLLEPEGMLPPVLPEELIEEHHKSERYIRIRGGGTIYYGGCDDPAKIGSLNLSGIGIDEAVELTEDDFTMLRGRVRVRVDGLVPQIAMACNPSGPSHWIAKRFGLDGESKPADGCEAITSSSVENTFLPDWYVSDLLTFTGVSKLRYVDGRWVQAQGVIYPFVRSVHVRDRHGPWKRSVAGIDWGVRAPSAIVVICEDLEKRLHVAAEFHKAGLLEPELIAAAKQLQREYSVEKFAVDPSALALIEAMRREGLPVVAADNAVLPGIGRVSKYFPCDGSGTPGITISPACQALCRELETYRWKDNGKDQPVKENDHSCDALRYGVMELTGEPELSVRVISPGGNSSPSLAAVENRQWKNVWQNF